jgi:tRNA(Ile)-lysidine synthase
MVKQVMRTIAAHNMVATADRVVAAVSGGPDSVCLLDVLHRLRAELGMELIVAHFNHGLRPHEDEEETAFVMRLAASFGLPVETGKAFPLDLQGSSLEERARHARYDFLEFVRDKASAQKIALGHSLNDQAETVLMRLLRGSGPRGLAGIPFRRSPGIIRPLMEVPRSHILQYLAERGLGWMTDRTNQDMRHTRNRIRGELIPLLEKYQPRAVAILAQTGEVLRRDDEWLGAEASEWLDEQAVKDRRGDIRIPVQPFSRLPAALKGRVIRGALAEFGEQALRRVGFRHLEAVAAMAEAKRPHGQLMLPHGVEVYRVYDHLVFTGEKREPNPEYRYVIQQPGTYRLEDVGMSLSLDEVTEVDPGQIGRWSQTAHLDGDKLGFPLVVRNMRAGDRFVPFGMAGTKKLKDFFMDRKVPLFMRYRVPILTWQDKPVWVCGMRIDDRYKVTSKTRRVLRVQIQEENR